jgi:glycosyltransferase involved in cell wall biosynthesis
VLRKLPVYEVEDLDFSRAWLVSQSLKQHLVEDSHEGLQDRPIIYSGLNPSFVKLKKRYTKQGRFVWAGRLSEAKAPDLALQAIARLNEAGVSVRLDIFGMGEPIERKQMREQIDSMGLADCVTMVGIRPGEMATHYAEYDALLFTSRCNDPFPMTPIEAMWSGLPCILSSDGGIQEVVADAETALLFERDSVDGLIDAIQRFLDLDDAGEAMAKKCNVMLQERYSMDIYLDRVESLLSSSSKVVSV